MHVFVNMFQKIGQFLYLLCLCCTLREFSLTNWLSSYACSDDVSTGSCPKLQLNMLANPLLLDTSIIREL